MSSERTYRAVNVLFRGVFGLLGLHFVVDGAQHIPERGAALLSSNHLSYLDFTFVGLAASRRRRLVRFMAKKATFDNPVSGPLMRRMRHIPVDRTSGAAAYRKAVRTLAAGELVGIFPEATISRTWRLKSFKLGAATLAVREQVPLVPVVLWAPQRTFTVDRHYSLRRGKTIMVMIGAPIQVDPGAEPVDVDAELRRRMDILLEHAIREYPDQPRGDGDRWWLPAEQSAQSVQSVQSAQVSDPRAER